ncbi:LOW QUALITY PROTEIN: uncharacterized protein LOC121235963 [Juglans microcarpa x Juglans regia]|nr:LOW QUALITY PROTEIN: uncharacterized protein LOC121235963 [Juglans microcarpa x Juglans regia]
MAYGACYLKGTRFFDRGGMIRTYFPVPEENQKEVDLIHGRVQRR